MLMADLGAEVIMMRSRKGHESPWQFSETPAKIGIAPALGAHNVPILSRLGYNEAQIQELKGKNVI
jgi:crotonobetainyl-CoA:carnitine CoA-transferase CaiB-like acyl-CoA transferase